MENLNLIRKLAWSFYKTTHVDFDDLFQEAVLSYLESLKHYNPERGKLSTFLWWNVTSTLKNYVKKELEYSSPLKPLDGMNFPTNHSAPSIEEKLNADALLILNTLQENEMEYTSLHPKEAKKLLSENLVSQGIPLRKIWSGVRNIHTVLKN